MLKYARGLSIYMPKRAHGAAKHRAVPKPHKKEKGAGDAKKSLEVLTKELDSDHLKELIVKAERTEIERMQMARLIGALFPLKKDKDLKSSLERLIELSKRHGFKELQGLFEGVANGEHSTERLEKAAEQVVEVFRKEAGVDIAGRPPEEKHENSESPLTKLIHKL